MQRHLANASKLTNERTDERTNVTRSGQWPRYCAIGCGRWIGSDLRQQPASVHPHCKIRTRRRPHKIEDKNCNKKLATTKSQTTDKSIAFLMHDAITKKTSNVKLFNSKKMFNHLLQEISSYSNDYYFSLF
jgi:hypothetical protein